MNLFRFRPRAGYAAGTPEYATPDADVSGEEALGRYIAVAAPLVASLGGRALFSAPVDVGPLLQEVLWDAHHAVILTSATLSAGKPPSFDFVRGRLGVEDAEEAVIGSPFDYTRQARLVLRHDLPDPGRDRAAYDAELPTAVWEAIRRTQGSRVLQISLCL